VRLGIRALVALMIISLSVWLLRTRAIEEITPDTAPEQEEGAEATHWEELEDEKEEWLPSGTPSAEGAPPREAPPPGEEHPERRGETPQHLGGQYSDALKALYRILLRHWP
jgi:hypothetical protein